MTANQHAPIAVRELAGGRDLLGVLHADSYRYPCLLESAAQAECGRSRWDILFAFPETSVSLDTDGSVRDQDGCVLGTRFLDTLHAQWQSLRIPFDEAHNDIPFRGGWVIYLGYALGSEIEPSVPRLVDPGRHLPQALALRCPAAILVDRLRGCTLLVAEAGRDELIDALATDIERAAAVAKPSPAKGFREDPAQRFVDGVDRVHEYLLAGDVFQVNLSRGWQVEFADAIDATAIYAALRCANPAPFAGLLCQPRWAIASSSPERLVEVRGDRVQTRPIAGTFPRLAGEDIEARMRELLAHPKERAEHIMLVDLERNDLGRVCRPGSVEVDELMSVESYVHVHHIVSNVRGQLREDVGPVDVIRAVFPGGTITGCPKVRCMQIIAELEATPRGAYTGSLGYLNRDGELDLNILIRTLELEGSTAWLRAGAGLVADSIASRELDETRAKARGLLRAMGFDR